MEWQLEIRNPLGGAPFTRDVTNPVKELTSFALNGYGDCKEALFTGLGGVLGIAPRSIVTLQSRATTISPWVNRYAGFVSRAGAARNKEATQFKLMGLRKRLYETELQADTYSTTTGQDVGAVARQMVQDVIATGQLGSSVIYNAALIPNAGFNTGLIQPKFNSLGTLLDALADSVPGVVWGVNANREVFFGLVTGNTPIDEGVIGTQITWEDTDADSLVTAVRWIIGGKVAHISVSPLEAVYGRSVITRGLDTNLVPYENITYTETLANVDVTQTVTGAQTGRVLTRYQKFAGGTMDVVRTPSQNYDRISVEVKKIRNSGTGELNAAFQMETGAPSFTRLYPLTENNNVNLAYSDKFTLGAGVAGVDVFMALYCDQAHIWEVYAFDFQVVSTSRLDEMATALYKLPATAPATVRMQGLIPPAPTAIITRRAQPQNPASAITETLTLPAAQYEYRITGEEYGVTTVKIEQPDTPERLAYNNLIKARDLNATIEAIRIGAAP